MKQVIEGFEVYDFTAYVQIYDDGRLVARIAKSGKKWMDRERVAEKLAELTQ